MKLTTTIFCLLLASFASAKTVTHRYNPLLPRTTGIASSYGKEHQGRYTNSGERFDYHKLTAAHRTLPFGSIVKVTNLENGKSVVVRINDRGPGWPLRIIDVSTAAAQVLGFDGLVTVRIKVLSYGKVHKDYSHLVLNCQGRQKNTPCRSKLVAGIWTP